MANHNFSTCCRLCLGDSELKAIFGDSPADRTLPQKISSSLGVEITNNDKLSTLVCARCIEKVNSWQSFKILCAENQSKLEQWLTGNVFSELNIQIKEEPLDNDGPSSVELVSGEFPIKSEPIEEQYEDELPPSLTPQHLDESSNEVAASPASVVPDTEVAEDFNPRKCRICGKVFSSHANRRKHEKNLHNFDARLRLLPPSSDSDYSLSSQQDDSQSSIPATPQVEPSSNAGSSSDQQKIQFAAGLKLLQRNAAESTTSPRSVSDQLSPLELTYVEKCEAMVTMHSTQTCYCHNVRHANSKSLLCHLRSMDLWFPVYTCYHCMVTHTDRSSATKHHLRCPKIKYGNLIRMGQLRKRSEVKKRLYQNFKCTECRFVYWFHEDYCKHIDEDHSNSEFPKKCTCSTTFTSLESYRDHVYVSCMVEYFCDICNATLPSLESFEKHAQDEHDNSEGLKLKYGRENYRKNMSMPDLSSYKRKRTFSDGKNVRAQRRTHYQSPPELLNEVNAEVNEKKVLNPLSVQHKCPICKRGYSSNTNMLRHYRTHIETETTTSSLNGSSSNENDLYACPDCKGMFNAIDWEKHKEQHQKKTCEECGKIFQFQSELDQHRSVHLNIKLYRDSKTQNYKSAMLSSPPLGGSMQEEESPVVLLCDICDKIFSTKDELHRHKLLHDVADSVSQSSSSPTFMERPFKCQICHKDYVRRQGLWEHTRVKHPGVKLSSKPFSKFCCDKEFNQAGPYRMHMKKHEISETNESSNSQMDEEEDEQNDDESYFTCKRCFKVFGSRSSWRSHMRSHGITISPMKPGKKPAAAKKAWCDVCHCVFDSVGLLNEHKMNDHQSNDDDDDVMQIFTDGLSNDAQSLFTCDVCVQMFTTKWALKKHKEKHARENVGFLPKNKSSKIVCKVCKVAFENETILMKHMQIEHMVQMSSMKKRQNNEEQHEFKCKMCPKSFTTKMGLDVHSAWHRRPGRLDKRNMLEPLVRIKEEPFDSASIFKCGTCGEQHTTDTALQIHILAKHRNVDAIVLPSKCSKCNKVFTNQDEFEKHKKLHNVIEQKTKDKANYLCTHCPAAYSKPERLKVHLKQAHGVEQYSCSQCDRTFDKQMSLQIHLKVHEKQKMSSGTGKKAVAATATVAASTPPPLFSCSICNRGFNVPKDLRMHTIEEHPFGKMARNS